MGKSLWQFRSWLGGGGPEGAAVGKTGFILFVPVPWDSLFSLLFSLWMLRDLADCPPAHRDWGTPCLHANIQGPGDPGVQLCAATLVKPAAHPSEWGLGWEG